MEPAGQKKNYNPNFLMRNKKLRTFTSRSAKENRQKED